MSSPSYPSHGLAALVADAFGFSNDGPRADGQGHVFRPKQSKLWTGLRTAPGSFVLYLDGAQLRVREGSELKTSQPIFTASIAGELPSYALPILGSIDADLDFVLSRALLNGGEYHYAEAVELSALAVSQGRGPAYASNVV